ncbi:MAG: DUF6036 family nucleotidyltransferase [Pseudomonadota bacterium]
MKRSELEHAIRAACDVSGDNEVIIFGSQAILGQFPFAHADLLMSAEADVMPKNHPEKVDEIDGCLGEMSQFHETHGFYVHGVDIACAKLPKGWQERWLRVQNQNTRYKTGYCIEAHDLAASKLAAFRPKDTQFVALLISEHLVNVEILKARIEETPIDENLKKRILRWIQKESQQ